MSGPAQLPPVFGIALAKAAPVAGEPAQMGSKAFNLQRMAAAGLPVPQAFVLGTGWCALHQRDPGADGGNEDVRGSRAAGRTGRSAVSRCG